MMIMKVIMSLKDIMEEVSQLNLNYVINIAKNVKNSDIQIIINFVFLAWKIIDIFMINNLI